MNCCPFKFKHYKDLISLLESQRYPDVASITYKTLPKVGFIAYLGKKPISAGFLRRLEPSFAHIDTLVSNGFFGSQVRHEAVTTVVNALLEEAVRLKLTGLIATTSDAGILKRAEDLGFKVVQQTILAIDLTRTGGL